MRRTIFGCIVGVFATFAPISTDTPTSIAVIRCVPLISADKSLVVFRESSDKPCSDESVFRIDNHALGFSWVRVQGGDDRFVKLDEKNPDLLASLCSSFSYNRDTYTVVTTLWSEANGCSEKIPNSIAFVTVASGASVNQICHHPGIVCRDLVELDTWQNARITAAVLLAANTSAFYSAKRLWSSVTK